MTYIYTSIKPTNTPINTPPPPLTQAQIAKEVVGAKRTEYAYSLYILDEAVGAIVSTLERLEMMDNTYLIFASDNGGELLLLHTSPYTLSIYPLDTLNTRHNTPCLYTV